MSNIINGEPSSGKNDVFAVFKRLSRRRAVATEQCELCSVGLAEPHPHLLDPKTRQVLCACDACAMVFCGQEGARYLRIPRQVRQFTCDSALSTAKLAGPIPQNQSVEVRLENPEHTAITDLVLHL